MSMSRRRDIVVKAIELSKPERVPIIHSPLPGALLKYGDKLIQILRRYPDDFTPPEELQVPSPNELPPWYRKGVHRDEWGITWSSTIEGIRGQVIKPPLEDPSKIDEYTFPPLPKKEGIEKLKRIHERKRDKGYFVALWIDSNNFFERLQWLRGFDNLMRDLIRKPKHLYILAGRLLNYLIDLMEVYLETKPDAIFLADDWGVQDRLMIKPSLWREFFKPRYKKLISFIKDHDAYVFFHSDGYILDIVHDFYELGVDVLNPQFSCHNLERLAEAVRDKLCILSDIDRQYVLPRGSPDEVRRYVRCVIDLFGYENNGGLICRGEINVDVPLENVIVMYEAFINYGKYKWQNP